jgi:hypothetical protein
MWKYTYETTINAQADRVFDLISNFSHSAGWNPFVLTASGPAEMGGVITGTVKLGILKLPYRHRIFEYVQNQSVCWRDFGFLALIYCGQRSRYIEARELQISGPLSGLVRLLLGRALCNGVVAETEALKKEVEKAPVSN